MDSTSEIEAWKRRKPPWMEEWNTERNEMAEEERETVFYSVVVTELAFAWLVFFG